MDRRRRKKHKAQKRALGVCFEHRPFLDTMSGGTKNVGKLEHAVADVATRFGQQASCRIEQQMATDRCQAARDSLHNWLGHVVTVSTVVAGNHADGQVFERPPYASDEDLLARADAIHTAAAAQAALFVNEGHPGMLDTLASEIEAFRKAKATHTLARQKFTGASEAIDKGLAEGDQAIAVLEGIFKNSPDAPAGALTMLKQAKRIGPRDEEDPPAEPNAESTPAAPVPVAPVPPVPNNKVTK